MGPYCFRKPVKDQSEETPVFSLIEPSKMDHAVGAGSVGPGITRKPGIFHCGCAKDHASLSEGEASNIKSDISTVNKGVVMTAVDRDHVFNVCDGMAAILADDGMMCPVIKLLFGLLNEFVDELIFR